MIITGKAVAYNEFDNHKKSTMLLPGCLNDWLSKGEKLPLVFEHHLHLEIGETLSFEDREDGIYHTSMIHDTPRGNHVKRLIEAGVLDSFSFCYWYNKTKYSDISPEGFARHIRIGEVVKVDELSIVCSPGFPSTVMDGLQSKKLETFEQTIARLKKVFDVRWPREAEEINQIILSKLRLCRESYYSQLNSVYV